MTEGDGLYKAILAEPLDDSLRLIYADWLEECGGQPERAEFIRVQVELAKLPEISDAKPKAEPVTYAPGGFNTLGMRSGLYDIPLTPAQAEAVDRIIEKRKVLGERQQKLWDEADAPSGWKLTAEALPHIPNPARWNHGLVCLVEKYDRDNYYALYRRGFLGDVRAPIDFLERCLSDIRNLYPITSVVATDKTPTFLQKGYWTWHPRDVGMLVDHVSRLPRPVYNALPPGVSNRSLVPAGSGKVYDSKQDALDALSQGLLKLSRPAS